MDNKLLLNNINQKSDEKPYIYYIDLNWIPLNDIDLKRSRFKSGFSPIRKSEIVKSISDRIFEISDPFLFYTDIPGEYEWIVYEFDRFRVVKFRLKNDDSFKLCIKSKDQSVKFVENIITNVGLKPSISKIKRFNSNIYYDFDKPIFISKYYNYTSDVIALNGKIYLSIGRTDYFIVIGKTDMKFHTKAQVNFVDLFDDNYLIQIILFDVYLFGEQYLRLPYLERLKYIDQLIKQEYFPNIKIKSPELQEIQNRDETDKIIVDNDSFQYMEWSKENTVITQYKNNLSEEILHFSDSIYEYRRSEKKDNQLLNDQFGNGSVVKYQPLSQNIIGHSCDSMKLDSIKSCKYFSRYENYDLDVLLKISVRSILHIRKTIIKNYASGKILVITDFPLNIADLEYDELKTSDINDSQPLSELKKTLEKYHTIIIDKKHQIANPFVTELINTKKIILFNFDNSWEIKDVGQKTFIFLVGTIGSGKSALIRKVRTMVNMSGGIFIAQIDKLIENDVEFICSPTTETYWKLRNKIYNSYMDQLISQSIVQSNSIILETTNVNNEYVQWLKSYGYKIVIAIVNETYENICENIKTRNMLKDRKTALSKEEHFNFELNIRNYTKLADIVLNLKPEYSE